MVRQSLSAIISGAGCGAMIITDLFDAVLERDGVDNDLYRLSTPEGKSIIGQMADLVVAARKSTDAKSKSIVKATGPQPRTTVEETFLLRVGGSRTTDELVGAGCYEWVNDVITPKNFPVHPSPDHEAVIELVKFDCTPMSDQVIEEFRRHQLERPTYEQAFLFGEQHPEVQRQFPVVFLIKPWVSSLGRRCVLCLYQFDCWRYLDLTWFDNQWPRDYRFAGVCKT